MNDYDDPLYHRGVDADAAERAFETAADLNAQIRDQNVRFESLQTVFADEEEIRTLAEQGIAEEQQGSFIDLTELGRASRELYEAVGMLGLAVAGEVNEQRATGEALETESAQESALLEEKRQQQLEHERIRSDSILKSIEQLSPRAYDRVKELLNGREQGMLQADELRQLEERVLAIFAEMDLVREQLTKTESLATEVQGLIDQGGEAWELPRALFRVFGSDMTQWAFIDELPVEPMLSPTGFSRYNELKGRHVDQPEASLYATLYFIEHSGKTVTVDELAEFLYSPETIDNLSDYHIRARVTTVLGPVTGAVQDMLKEEGYLLQYGYRRALERDNGAIKIKTRKRIYRVVPQNDISPLGNISYETDEYKDDFELTPEVQTLLLQEEAREDETQERSHPTPEWVKEFRLEVGSALAELEEADLLGSREGETIKVARIKSRSRVFATEDTLSKLINSGLLRHLQRTPRGVWGSQIVSPAEMVVLKLFNTNLELLSKGNPRRRNALRVIEESVNSYFTHREG